MPFLLAGVLVPFLAAADVTAGAAEGDPRVAHEVAVLAPAQGHR